MVRVSGEGLQPLPRRAGGDKGAGGGGKLSLTLTSPKTVDQSGADSDADGKAWRLIFNRRSGRSRGRTRRVWGGEGGGTKGMEQSTNVIERPGGSGPGTDPPPPSPSFHVRCRPGLSGQVALGQVCSVLSRDWGYSQQDVR